MARVHDIADRIEPRVAKALGLAFLRLRDRLPLGEIEAALARNDARVAGELIDGLDVEDVLEPVAGILEDALDRGGKTGMQELPRG